MDQGWITVMVASSVKRAGVDLRDHAFVQKVLHFFRFQMVGFPVGMINVVDAVPISHYLPIALKGFILLVLYFKDNFDPHSVWPNSRVQNKL